MGVSREPLLNSGVALALLTAALYCVSTAYYGGFLAVLRLDADVLDRNFHQILYHGFLTAFVPVFQLLAWSAIVLFASAMLGTPALNAFLRRRWSRKRVFVVLRKALRPDARSTAFEIAQRKLAGYACIALAFALTVIFALAHFDRQGKEAGEKLLSKLDQPVPDSFMVSVKIDGQPHRLLYLACGARNCAGIEPTTRMVHYFPQNGHAFRHPQPAAPVVPESESPREPESGQASPNRSALARSQ
jgi:hypothetical protein